MNTYKLQEYFKLLLLTLLVLLSRLPFLNAGYGVEEDSWGIAVAAYHTQLYGIMEASRLPGHPVNEFIYSIFWGYGPWLFNFFSAAAPPAQSPARLGTSEPRSGEPRGKYVGSRWLRWRGSRQSAKHRTVCSTDTRDGGVECVCISRGAQSRCRCGRG